MALATALLASVPVLATALGTQAYRTGLHGPTGATAGCRVTAGLFPDDSGVRSDPFGHPCLFGLRPYCPPGRLIERREADSAHALCDFSTSAPVLAVSPLSSLPQCL